MVKLPRNHPTVIELEKEIKSHQRQRKFQNSIVSFYLNSKLKQLKDKEKNHLKEWTKTEKIIYKYGKL